MKAHNILIPTDFSETSNSILKLAESFVSEFGSTIHLMHVVPVTQYFRESFEHIGYPYDLEQQIYPTAQKAAQEKLEKLAEEHIKKEHRGKVITTIDRKPSKAITEEANSGKYDAILMATRGRDATEFLRGSVTEKVIRRSEIPVLSLDTHFDKDTLNNIMVPLDMSESSFAALPPAIQLAHKFNAGITLFHSVELYTADVELVPLFPPFDNEEAVRVSLLNRMAKYISENTFLGATLNRNDDKKVYSITVKDDEGSYDIQLHAVVTKGFSANRDIVDYANENADLVVMSTHGHTGLARLFLGSTTEQVSQHVHVPLLTVRPMPREK